MATNQFKRINQGSNALKESKEETTSVMVPFIKFGIGAMKMITHTLIQIVKSIPKPEPDKPAAKGNTRIIKIK